jgi:glycerophosphoryl diester phosphodiesterase
MPTSLFKKDRLSSEKRRPLVIAHRGASGLAPENTIAAFKLAIALGADGVEMDVQLSADNRAVVIHDARVNRTTNETGLVENFTARHLAEMDAGAWFDRKLALRPRLRAMSARATQAERAGGLRFSGEPVPTLGDALAVLSLAKFRRIYIELKSRQKDNQALLETTIALVREFKLEQTVALLSFDHEIIRRAGRMAQDISRAATFSIGRRGSRDARSIIDSAKRACANEAALHYGLATRRLVTALRENGIAVSVWTANSKLVMRRLAACGVDAIMTNFPNRLIDVLESQERDYQRGNFHA